MATRPVSAEEARPRIDPARLAGEAEPPPGVGAAAMRLQPRARATLELAVTARAPGFHVFAAGSPHLGKVDAVVAMLQAATTALPRADDWAAVFDEARHERPLPLRLPPGEGPRYARTVADAVARFGRELPRTLRSATLRRKEAALQAETQAAEQRALATLKEELKARRFVVRRSEGQLEATPLWRGKPVTRPLEQLPAAQRADLEARLPEVSELVEAINEQLGEIVAAAGATAAGFRRAAVLKLAGRVLEPARRAFAGCADAAEHLARLEAALVDQHERFLEDEPLPGPPGAPPPPGPEERLKRFAVHVLVSHAGAAGPPVVKEGNPTGPALFGTLSREAEFGVLKTDFTHLRPGALHRANGGFLVVPARALVTQPEVWAALKRALRTGELRHEEGLLDAAQLAAQPLAPAPVPLACTVVLTGEVEIFDALYEQDPDFRELFGLRADFDDAAALDDRALADACAVLAALGERERLLPLDAGGRARVLEAALRLADDQRRLSLEWDLLRLLLVQAGHEAKADGAARVGARHVRRAEEAAAWRGGLHRARLLEQVRRGLLRAQVHGEAVGQVNALALSSLGDTIIGRVARVAARVGPGTRGLIDVEHRASLSGPVHAKAVWQLQGYLLGRFGAARPLAFDATLTFEQSYVPVEGDSASVAELVALVSSLSELPVRQSLAVSCSLGQDGAAQVVGGLSDKVEGFFDTCHALGLDGTQGVIIAATNVQHLVLREDVVEAIAQGRFHVHAIEHADDALALLLGCAPAELDERVARRLDAFAAAVRRATRGEPGQSRSV